jgi:hypothetical protein
VTVAVHDVRRVLSRACGDEQVRSRHAVLTVRCQIALSAECRRRAGIGSGGVST